MASNELALSVVVVTLVVLVLISWYKWEISNTRKGTPPLPPGPKGLPVVGSFPFLGPNLHEELTNISHQYGPIFKLYLGSKLHIVVNSADLAKAITGEQDESFANRSAHIAGLAASHGANDIAFAPNNANRRKLRKVLVQEVLSNVNLEASHAYRRHEVRKAVKYVYDRIGRAVDINEISFSTVLNVLTNIIWRKGFVDETNYSNLSENIRKVVPSIVEIAEGLNISDFFPMLARFDLQGVERKMKNQIKQFDKIIETTIEERTNSKSTNIEETVEHKERKDCLQILLELTDDQNTGGTSITMTQLKAIVVDIFLGGTDSTSAMVEWAMTEILRNQKVMKRVQDELEEIVGLSNVVEESHVPKLKYLEAVFKETFRLHPPLPFLLPRAPNKPCTVGGYTVPEGSTIFLNVWAIQRDPQHWVNPSEFNPDRFLNSNGSQKWDYSGTNPTFLPFGSGRRRCPGIPLGEKMMMHILASLMHSFEWKLPAGEKLDLSGKFGIALKKKKPLVAVPTKRLTELSLYM